jgi:integrase
VDRQNPPHNEPQLAATHTDRSSEMTTSAPPRWPPPSSTWAVPNDRLGAMEKVLYSTAAMIGLRQGELVALRWRDVDRPARVIRVRQSFSRGRFGPPKSKRSSRAVPLADRVAGELENHFQRAAFQADSDLVFCHPDTGRPYDASRLR